jgi:hypothetical protein
MATASPNTTPNRPSSPPRLSGTGKGRTATASTPSATESLGGLLLLLGPVLVLWPLALGYGLGRLATWFAWWPAPRLRWRLLLFLLVLAITWQAALQRLLFAPQAVATSYWQSQVALWMQLQTLPLSFAGLGGFALLAALASPAQFPAVWAVLPLAWLGVLVGCVGLVRPAAPAGGHARLGPPGTSVGTGGTNATGTEGARGGVRDHLVALLTSLGLRRRRHFRSLREVVRSAKATPWLVQEWCAEGCITQIGGRPKEGKSTLVRQLVWAVVMGRPFLDQYAVSTRTHVLYCTEEGDETVAPPFARWDSVALARVEVLSRRQVRAFTLDEVLQACVKRAKQKRCKVVVLDTFRSWCLPPGKNERDPVAMQAAYEQLQDVASRQHLAIILVHHTIKGDGDVIDQQAGSNAGTGQVDMLMGLRRLKNEPATVREAECRGRFGCWKVRLAYSRAEDRYRVVAEGETVVEEEAEGQEDEEGGEATAHEWSASSAASGATQDWFGNGAARAETSGPSTVADEDDGEDEEEEEPTAQRVQEWLWSQVQSSGAGDRGAASTSRPALPAPTSMPSLPTAPDWQAPLLAIVRQHPGYTANQVGEVAGLHRSHIHRRLVVLMEQGLLRYEDGAHRKSPRRWFLTEEAV